MIDKINHGH